MCKDITNNPFFKISLYFLQIVTILNAYLFLERSLFYFSPIQKPKNKSPRRPNFGDRGELCMEARSLHFLKGLRQVQPSRQREQP